MNFNLTPTSVTFFSAAILVAHLAYLLFTRHADNRPFAGGALFECGDHRETARGSTQFGGASSFTFGLGLGLAGMYLPMPYWLAVVCIGYANMKLLTSVAQTLIFMWQSAKAPIQGNFRLKSHWNGCGYATASSPLWILFWVQKIPGFGWVVFLRDVITTLDFVFSLPAVMGLNVWTLLVRRRFTIPTIRPVDNPHP